MMVNMLKDIFSFAKIFSLIFMGFVYACFIITDGKIAETRTIPSTALFLFRATVGQFDWDAIKAEDGGLGTEKSDFMELIVCAYTIAGIYIFRFLMIEDRCSNCFNW